MKSENLTKAEGLQQQISTCNQDQRLDLQPELSKLVNRMIDSGETVPLALKRLEAALNDEAVEASFDNMPV